MKKHLYILGTTNTDGNKDSNKFGRWDSIAKGQKIRKTIGKVENNVITIITSSNQNEIRTAEGIADGLGLKTFGINLEDNLCENNCNESNIEQIVNNIEEFIKNNLVIIVITHYKNVGIIAEKLGLNGKKYSHTKNISGQYYEL